MGNVTVLNGTTKNPITTMGERAGICWGSPIDNPEANYIRGMNCVEQGHGRVLEYPRIELLLEGYSAKVIREWYTHIGGAPTRLQASTRYIQYTKDGQFPYVTPKTIEKDEGTKRVFDACMATIATTIQTLKALGVPNEDANMCLPLTMETKIVDSRNLRNLIDMSRNRTCNRAYWEYRELYEDIEKALAAYSYEWEVVVDLYLHPKCEELGYCPEKKGCGKYPPKE